MADLTTLEEKLAEVTGLAGAAQEATKKVESLLNGSSLADSLRQMREEAEETESRCVDLAEQREGKKTAILEKAQETKNEATEMMRTYLGEDSDELDGFEFLTMAEAGEVGHWAILGKLNEVAGEDEVQELVDWALPIQERWRLRRIRTPKRDEVGDRERSDWGQGGAPVPGRGSRSLATIGLSRRGDRPPPRRSRLQLSRR